MDTTPNKRLSIAYIHPKEAIIAAIATVGGWFGDNTSIFIHKSYIFYIRMRVDFGQCTSYGTNQHQPYITQQSNGVGVRFLCGVDGLKTIWNDNKLIFTTFLMKNWGDGGLFCCWWSSFFWNSTTTIYNSILYVCERRMMMLCALIGSDWSTYGTCHDNVG